MYQVQEDVKKRTRRRSKKENKVQTIDMSENQIYEILENETLSAEEMENKLIEMLSLDTSSIENVEQNFEQIKHLKNLVKQVLNQFAEHNKKSIELTRDNPLSKLSSGIKEVFENYHVMSEGREGLKSTLKTVDGMLKDLGGEEQLVAAMLNAKSKAKELGKLTEKTKISFDTFKRSKVVLTEFNRQLSTENNKLRELTSGFFSFLKSSEIEETKKEISRLKQKKEESLSLYTEADAKYKVISEKLSKLKSSKDFAIHEKILEILDIGDESFKTRLAELAGVTLQYIDDTQLILTQVRDQLEMLLTDVSESLDVNINIRERVTILSSALMKANDKSIDNLSAFKESNKDEDSSLAKLENEKLTRIADSYISEIADTMTSTGMINSEVQKIEVVIMSLRDQLKNGLLDANEQLLISVNNATASGMVMMNKAQTLGTLAQSVVAKGQYMKEAEETFGDLADEFKSQLAVRAGRNNTLDSMTDVLHTISEALEDTNDDSVQLITDQRDLIKDLNDGVDRLKEAAQTARSLQSSAKVGDYK